MTNPNPVAPKTDTPATRPTPPNPVRMGKRSVTVAYGVMQTTKYVDSAEAYITHLESTLAAERASRVQAEEALRAARHWINRIDDSHQTEAAPHHLIEEMDAVLSKPSVSPEQAEEGK